MDEQLLMAIVKGRYGETTSLLSVNGVAANVRFNTQAGVNFGFGPESSYSGNLVPFSGSGTYEENPTITYAPVHGEKYIRQLRGRGHEQVSDRGELDLSANYNVTGTGVMFVLRNGARVKPSWRVSAKPNFNASRRIRICFTR